MKTNTKTIHNVFIKATKATMEVTISEAAQLALACPQNAIVLDGAPGSGKTFGTTAELEKAGYRVVRIDAQNVPSDWLAALPVVDKNDPTVVHMASHDMWKPQARTAFILDELYKADKHIVDAFLPLVFGNEFMGHKYGADTIRIITTNGRAFSLGDRELPHMGNRTTRLHIRDLTVKEAQKTMVNLSFDYRVLQWMQEYPQALVSYNAKAAKLADSEDKDYFGYKPSDPTRKFCSMRSLEIASGWLKAKDDGLPDALVRSAVAGAIGERAALSLFSYINENSSEKLPTYADMIKGNFDVEGYTQFGRRNMVVKLACSALEEDKAGLIKAIAKFDNEFRRLFTMYVVHKYWALNNIGQNKEWDKLISPR